MHAYDGLFCHTEGMASMINYVITNRLYYKLCNISSYIANMIAATFMPCLLENRQILKGFGIELHVHVIEITR